MKNVDERGRSLMCERTLPSLLVFLNRHHPICYSIKSVYKTFKQLIFDCKTNGEARSGPKNQKLNTMIKKKNSLGLEYFNLNIYPKRFKYHI